MQLPWKLPGRLQYMSKPLKVDNWSNKTEFKALKLIPLSLSCQESLKISPLRVKTGKPPAFVSLLDFHCTL